jgi:hypothetical protein
LVWSIAEKIGYGVLKFEIFNKSEKVDTLFSFFPLESMSNLIVEPISRLNVVKSIGNQVGVTGTKDYSVHLTGILIVLAWTVIFMLMSYKLLKKRDL